MKRISDDVLIKEKDLMREKVKVVVVKEIVMRKEKERKRRA
jgi:hypothetical protein